MNPKKRANLQVLDVEESLININSWNLLIYFFKEDENSHCLDNL